VGDGLLVVPDREAASAIRLPALALRAEATRTIAVGRLAHEFFAVAAAALVPVSITLARPHETTAVPASTPKAADPARRFLTASASP
jgi:hypothetical protein